MFRTWADRRPRPCLAAALFVAALGAGTPATAAPPEQPALPETPELDTAALPGTIAELEALHAADRTAEDRLDFARLAVRLQRFAERQGNTPAGQEALAAAALGHFWAGAPRPATPVDDPIRLEPAPPWMAYVSCVRTLRAWVPEWPARADIRGVVLTGTLTDWSRIGQVYDARYYDVAIETMRSDVEWPARAEAGLFAVVRAAAADWTLACELASELYALETNLRPQTRDEVDAAARFTEDLFRALSFELSYWRSLTRQALDLYYVEHGGYPDAAVFSDAAALWQTLAPHWLGATEAGRGASRAGVWMDLTSSRFEGVPRLEPRGAVWTETADGVSVPRAEFHLIFWDDYDATRQLADAPDAPWMLRRAARERTLQAGAGR